MIMSVLLSETTFSEGAGAVVDPVAVGAAVGEKVRTFAEVGAGVCPGMGVREDVGAGVCPGMVVLALIITAAPRTLV